MIDIKPDDNGWYDEMEAVHALLPDYAEAYIRLGRIFTRLIAEYTADSDILLAGSFAKTDYLLKTRNATPELRHNVNDMRLRLTRKTEAQAPELFMTDFRALCFFISLLTELPIPDHMSARFPKTVVETRHVWLSEDYLRVVVNSWDDEHILCTEELHGEDIRVLYAADGKQGGNDHSYLATLLYKGAMLNLIRPYIAEDGSMVPEFIILEPDFLVDVSTIVSCFDTYADSPLLALLKRLEPYEPTEAILLGHMASGLLDEVLHEKFQVPPSLQQLREAYRQTAMQFFRRNAVGVMSVAPGDDFHLNAWQQFTNIRTAMLQTLPRQVNRYDGNSVIVEPTFFSEMLGLQGRMDMLQTDMRLLVEQKSGKGGFRPGHADVDTPVYTEQHYMQMLLYMAIVRYNFRHVYEANGHELYAFLLYSKYRHPLIGLGFAPRLLFSALRMRNMYVAQESRMSRGGMTAIMDMCADDFNIKGTAGKLWQNYQRPRLERLLHPFREVSPLERAYFERFYRFVALEHRLSKVGNQTKENSGFASAWLSSTDEKAQAGDILLDLDMVLPPVPGSADIEEVTLCYDGDTGNFRRGDIVVLYSYLPGQEPDMRRTMTFRATIIGMEPAAITLQLRNAQRDAVVFRGREECRWCLEHDFMESSYSALYKGLYAFLLSPQERRDLLMMRRMPAVSGYVPLRGEYGAFNELQQRIKAARDLFLIIGPPGTGKTSFGMLNTLQEELREEGSKVLIVSYTNRAVDEICSKLYPDIDFIRIGGEASASQTYRRNMLGSVISECSSANELRNSILGARVLVGTTAAVSACLPIIGMSTFSLCIVDEASQILEPHLLPLLSLSRDGEACIRKFVMIGDHKQLSAVVQQRRRESRVENGALNEIGLTDCRNSLFERLLLKYRSNPDVCYMLTRQGRMHRDIARFPNMAFYGGRLEEVPLPHQLQGTGTRRVRFVDVLPYTDSPSDKVNIAEAEAVVAELCAIWETTRDNFVPSETVGVIVPYRNQISAIRTLLADRLGDASHPLLQISIDTVERYQGSQRNYIIYAFTISRPYQLRFLTETTFMEDGMQIDRKLNVAMTRALEYLILIGNASLIGRWPLYRRLLQYVGEGKLPV